jgi:hypothetical protein
MKKVRLNWIAACTFAATLLGTAGQAATIMVGADADTYTRAGVGAGAAANLDVRGFGGGDFVGYVRFDLSGVPGPVTEATLKLHETAGSRNDGITTGRHQLYGLTNAAGNTAQNWDESVDLDPGAEYDNTGGSLIDVAQVFNLDADAGANVTEAVPGSDDVDVTTSGADLVTFINSRLADGGLTTFLVGINANNRGYGFASRENENADIRPMLTLTVVPEPASWLLLGLAGMVAAVTRRRFI